MAHIVKGTSKKLKEKIITKKIKKEIKEEPKIKKIKETKEIPKIKILIKRKIKEKPLVINNKIINTR